MIISPDDLLNKVVESGFYVSEGFEVLEGFEVRELVVC